jgi:glycosyltransferase involved in cell wall biosynthesis
LAEALFDLLKDPLLRSEMGIHSRAIAEKEFSIELVISQTFALYQSCFDEPN